MNARLFLLSCILCAAFASPWRAVAQTPPSPGDVAGYSGLFGVTQSGAHNEIRQLLVNGLDPNSRDSNGRTPYLVAAYRGDSAAMEILMKGGADPRAKDNQNYDAITILAVANRVDAMKAAIALGGNPREITSPYLGTALIAAAHLGHADVVKALIDAGAPLDHVNNLGWTALIESIVLGDGGPNHQRCLRDLLAAGANPNLADRNGTSPLKLAEGRSYRAMVDMIRARGGQ
jgi:ankyrin repeat protein